MRLISANKHCAFTLLEVLIALVVVATALLALSGSMQQATKSQVYVKDKTLAHYVAMYRLGELRLEPQWPSPGTTRGEIKMLNRDWRWQQTVTKTTEASLRRVEIAVTTKDDENYKLSTITAFIGRPAKR